MTPTASLTEREKTALEHLQKAQELGATLTEYCAAFGVERNSLYAMKKKLVKKGALSSRTRETPDKSSNPFVPVRIVPSSPRSTAVACRLVHPSGWVIECGSFPPTDWLSNVLGGAPHAAS
jgi:hypothetical protein